MATKKLQILDSLNKNAVLYTPQELTEEEKAQVRDNLSVPSLDENGKIPTSQLPDDIGGGGGLTEVDWEESVVNKPFEDTRVMINYSYEENPNPVYFDCAPIGYSFYKISDMMLTKEDIFNSKVTINDRKIDEFADNDVLIETNELFIVQDTSVSNGYAFCVCYATGTCPFTFMGYSLSVNVPEVGIYRVNGLGLGMSDISTIEIFVSGELKTLDPKFISDMYYDTRIRSYYSQAENPNPLQFDNTMMNMSFYKVSDLIPTKSEIFNIIKLVINGDECTFDKQLINVETDDFIHVTTDDTSYSFCFINKSGTLSFTYSGYPMSLDVPEAGIYYQRSLNAGVPEGRTIEFLFGGELKQIDPKFIDSNEILGLDSYGRIPSNKLHTDTYVYENSTNPITGGAVYNALGGRNQLTIDDTVLAYSSNPVSSSAVYTAIENKKINVDSTVKSGSNNAVSGNAVYNALNDKQNKIVITSADNGKFLCVENGVITAKTISEWSGGSY